MSKMYETVSKIETILINSGLAYEIAYDPSEKTYRLKISESGIFDTISSQEPISMEELEDECDASKDINKRLEKSPDFNSLEELEAECNNSLDKIKGMRESFMTNHASRMKKVEAKLNDLFKDDYEDEAKAIDKALEETSNDLDDLIKAIW